MTYLSIANTCDVVRDPDSHRNVSDLRSDFFEKRF
jgi:hypothetical protein